MKRFRYEVVDTRHDDRWADLAGMLDKMGAKGWELVTARGNVLIFKMEYTPQGGGL